MLLLLGCFSACIFFYLAYKLIYDEWEKGIGIIFIICGIIVIIGSGKIQNDFHQFNVKITEDREKLKTKIAKEKLKRKSYASLLLPGMQILSLTVNQQAITLIWTVSG